VTAVPINFALPRRAVNPWVVAVAVVIPTFMEVLDTTIANVALRYIAGGAFGGRHGQRMGHHQLSGGECDHPPISGWLGARLGRRNYFSTFNFGVHYRLRTLRNCTSLYALIAFRVLQGLAGGGLQPSSQGVLLDAFPPESRGRR